MHTNMNLIMWFSFSTPGIIRDVEFWKLMFVQFRSNAVHFQCKYMAKMRLNILLAVTCLNMTTYHMYRINPVRSLTDVATNLLAA